MHSVAEKVKSLGADRRWYKTKSLALLKKDVQEALSVRDMAGR